MSAKTDYDDRCFGAKYDAPTPTSGNAEAEKGLEPVARVTDAGRLEWLIEWEDAKRLIGTKLYAHPPTSDWNDAIEAAAQLADEQDVGVGLRSDAIRGLKREPR